MNRNLNRRIHPIAEANGLSPKFHRKVKGKYVPCGRHEHIDRLSEGVWVVLSNLSHCSSQMASGDYLKDLFQINKVSGIEDVSIAK